MKNTKTIPTDCYLLKENFDYQLKKRLDYIEEAFEAYMQMGEENMANIVSSEIEDIKKLRKLIKK